MVSECVQGSSENKYYQLYGSRISFHVHSIVMRHNVSRFTIKNIKFQISGLPSLKLQNLYIFSQERESKKIVLICSCPILVKVMHRMHQ